MQTLHGYTQGHSNAYATSEPFEEFLSPSGYCGGNFWDGRAEDNLDEIDLVKSPALFLPPERNATKHIGTEIFYDTHGSHLVDVEKYSTYFGPVADQVLNPMPNRVEQNIDRKAVCEHVKSSQYAQLYKKAWGLKSIAATNWSQPMLRIWMGKG